jgi:hypothetical protein
VALDSGGNRECQVGCFTGVHPRMPPRHRLRSGSTPGRSSKGATQGWPFYESGRKPYVGYDGKMVEAVCFGARKSHRARSTTRSTTRKARRAEHHVPD